MKVNVTNFEIDFGSPSQKKEKEKEKEKKEDSNIFFKLLLNVVDVATSVYQSMREDMQRREKVSGLHGHDPKFTHNELLFYLIVIEKFAEEQGNDTLLKLVKNVQSSVFDNEQEHDLIFKKVYNITKEFSSVTDFIFGEGETDCQMNNAIKCLAYFSDKLSLQAETQINIITSLLNGIMYLYFNGGEVPTTPLLTIPINIWDDYYDDDDVPAGEEQVTKIYVETDEIPFEEKIEILRLVHKHLVNFIYITNGVEIDLQIDKEKEYVKLNLVNLTHWKREMIVNDLNLLGRGIYYKGKLLRFYSES